MNILFITPSFPSRLHRIRSWQLLQTLSRTHHVHLLSLAAKPPRADDVKALEQFCASVTVVIKPFWRSVIDVLMNILAPVPFEVSYCRSTTMNKTVRELIQKYAIDTVYVKRVRSAQFVSGIELPTILDSTDAMSLFYARAAASVSLLIKPLYLHERFAYSTYERALARTFKRWVVCSPVDAAYLTQHLPSDAVVSVIPNGVDTDYYTQTDAAAEPHTLLISGLFTKFVNSEAARYFVKRVLPLLRAKRPELVLYLVGPAGKEVRALADPPHIIVTGEVPDIRPYIARASIVCVPVLTGTGTRNKILQAWSIGRPVVSTPQGFEGLKGTAGDEILLAHTPQEFADSIVRLLDDTALRERLIANGSKLIHSTYAMTKIGSDIEALLGQRL